MLIGLAGDAHEYFRFHNTRYEWFAVLYGLPVKSIFSVKAMACCWHPWGNNTWLVALRLTCKERFPRVSFTVNSDHRTPAPLPSSDIWRTAELWFMHTTSPRHRLVTIWPRHQNYRGTGIGKSFSVPCPETDVWRGGGKKLGVSSWMEMKKEQRKKNNMDNKRKISMSEIKKKQ